MSNMRFFKLLLAVLLMTPLLLSAQKKIKYKNIFPQLSSGNYEAVRADLQIFLSNDKNDDHANAHYQMGAILEEEFYDMDILTDTTKIAAKADSANHFFKKAIELIDDRELRKNDEYYQAFHRRDLRTGEFGIKLSDVHLDIEKKIEAIQSRRKSIQQLHILLNRIKGRNNLSAQLYKGFVERTLDYTNLLFSFTENDLSSLDRMQDNARGIYDLSNEIKEIAESFNSEYFQGFQQFKIIEEYGKDGMTQTDVFTGEFDFWDYETWAEAAKDDYEGINDFKKNVKVVMSQIQSAEGQIAQGMKPEPISLQKTQTLAAQYDKDGSLMAWLSLNDKIAEFKIMREPALTQAVSDSGSVYAKTKLTERALKKLDTSDSLLSVLQTEESKEQATDRYADLMEAFHGGSAEYLVALQKAEDFITGQKVFWKSLEEELQARNQWAISGEDSVSLVPDTLAQGKYLTMGVSGDETKLIYGINTETKEGFLVWSGPQRDIKDKKNFVIGGLNPDETTTGEMPMPQSAFYFFDPSKDVNNLFLVSTSGVGEVKWTNLVTATQEPVEFEYDETLDQLTVFLFPKDDMPADPNTVSYLVIDRAGKVR